MATTRRGTSTAPATDNGAANGPVRKSTSATGIPSRAGRKRRTYPEWAEEIQYLRDNPGVASEFEADDVNNLANGLRRNYGVKASAQNVITEDNAATHPDAEDHAIGWGTLWLTFPTTGKAEDGTLAVDEDKVKATIAKYTK